MQTHTIGQGDNQRTFEGKQLDQKILGTGPDDTKQITYYKTLDGRYLKHEILGITRDESEREHVITEVSSFEVP